MASITCCDCGCRVLDARPNRLRCDDCRAAIQRKRAIESSRRTKARQAAGAPPHAVSCSDCGVEMVGVHRNRKLCPVCRERRRAVQAREKSIRYYARNTEARRAVARARYAADPDYQRTWREANREHVRAWDRERRLRDLPRVRAVEAAKSRLRRARKAGVGGSHTADEFAALCVSYDGCCAYCGVVPERLTADHVIPISRGGSDDIENIVPACASCNFSKGAAAGDEFLRRRAAA